MSTAIHYATGRRKTSSARVYLSKGKGKILVNNKELSHYFGRQVAQMLVMQPLKLTELDEQVDIKAMVKGGGSFGQAGAIRHGISRALLEFDEGLRPQLKSAGFLTRDDRKVERKKPGLPKEDDDDMNEVRQGLYLVGFNVDLVDWLLDSNLDIIKELNEVRRAVRLYGKGQQQVQAHATEAYSPVRVTGMAEKMGLIPGLAMDLTTRDEHGNPFGL